MISQHLELKVEIQNDVINKSQLLPTLYYEVTLPFLRFLAKHYY